MNRKQKILQLLHSKGSLTTGEISALFNLTPQTICRDINALCAEGKARRIHGGITLPATADNSHFNQRIRSNANGKLAAAKVAAKLISAGQTIFFGYGSTTAMIAGEVDSALHFKAITNNLNVAIALENSNAEVWLAGGLVRNKQRDVTGYSTASFLNRFRADIAFCGIGSINHRGELLEFNYEEAELTRLILNNSKQRIIVADQTKLERHASVFCTKISDVDALVIDSASTHLKEMCHSNEVKLMLGSTVS
ncbi:DeoR/GlpR family DNA-binding transcription regulator [Vibrio comitans]|uniref:DeoR family transcriptional regulator n=1 Tax=Vibrio comitans NBRC 102076 TaxID=1219078 RepID=A0A4Y3ITC8_9VIBR|nr:DeoR/GlpR family DNA-binding transcription regulator [Vibrio comitans]GEA61990.1 DeoR family transcriptional regulator [Vibrio comitans NBRC 102076]